MKTHALFIIAFFVITASLYKSFSGSKKIGVRSTNQVLAQWPGVMKKGLNSGIRKPPGLNGNMHNKKNSSSAGFGAVSERKFPTRGIASVSPPGPYASTSLKMPRIGALSGGKFKPRGFASSLRGIGSANYNFSTGYFDNMPQVSIGQVDPSNTSQGESSAQELSSFTRTPDLSMNATIDPEITESFEDQIRKFREQNQLSAQELRELEVITNSFNSMSTSVQRGQIPAPQVNAEAIKLTRSFINLKRRVEAKIH